MSKAIYIMMLVAGAIVLWGCSEAPKIEPRTAEAIKSDILAKTDDINSYLSTHDLVNTQPGVMANQLTTYSEEYHPLVTEVSKKQKTKPDLALDELLTLANEGVTSTQGLAKALADDPNANPAAFTELQTAITAWAAYTDKSILLATGKAPSGTPDQPGNGHHYGWWKNPNWANDPASRTATSAVPSKTGKTVAE